MMIHRAMVDVLCSFGGRESQYAVQDLQSVKAKKCHSACGHHPNADGGVRLLTCKPQQCFIVIHCLLYSITTAAVTSHKFYMVQGAVQQPVCVTLIELPGWRNVGGQIISTHTDAWPLPCDGLAGWPQALEPV